MRELDLVVQVSKEFGRFRNRIKRVDSTKKKAGKHALARSERSVREREAEQEQSGLQVTQMLENHLYFLHYPASRY